MPSGRAISSCSCHSSPRAREAAEDGAGQGLVARPLLQPQLFEAGQIVAEDGLRAAVGRAQPEAQVEGQYAGRQVGQHRFEVGLGRLHFVAMVFGLGSRLVQLVRHAVEGMGQHAQFVGGLDRGARREVAGRHRLRAFGEDQQRPRQALGEEEGQGDRGEQRQQQGQRQRQGVDVLEAGPAELQFLVVAMRRRDALRTPGDRSRHRLRQLQDARIGTETAVHRWRGAHHQAAARRLADLRQAAPPRAARNWLGAGNERQQAAQFDGTAAQHLAGQRQQDRGLRAGLLAQPIQAARTDESAVAQVQGRVARLGQQVGLQAVEHAAAEVEAALQRGIDAHVEPGIDALHGELHRYAIHQRAGQHRHQGEHQQQARLQARAEHAAAKSRRRRRSCRPTSTSSATAATPLIASSQG
jgi:hypothetical protein